MRPLLPLLALLLAPSAGAQSQWPNVALPTTFEPAGAGYLEDFEAIAGVVPTSMALTAIDPVSGLPLLEPESP